MRRYGVHSVSGYVEKVCWKRSKDNDVRRYACPVCGGRENENSYMMSRREEPFYYTCLFSFLYCCGERLKCSLNFL